MMSKLFEKRKDNKDDEEGKDSDLEVPPSTLGLHELYKPQDDTLIFADVIAVHGLGGDSFSTWTDKKTGTLWLRDLLWKSPYFSNTRIMTFGYDASKWVMPGETTAKGRVFTFAEELLARLRGRRILTKSVGRPIFFIGHSLGGILIKKALVLARARSELYQDIYESTKAITFLGTPHHGADAATWATYLTSISKVLGIRSSAATTELTLWSDTLLDLSREFAEQVPRYKLTSFFETQPYKGVTVVKEGSAYLGYHLEIVERLDANHRTICKYPGPESGVYQTVLEQLQVRMMEIGNDPEKVKVGRAKGKEIEKVNDQGSSEPLAEGSQQGDRGNITDQHQETESDASTSSIKSLQERFKGLKVPGRFQ